MIIRDQLLRLTQSRPGRRFLLLAYSKGTPDSLVALSTYPEIRPLVAGVISFAGAAGGSVLADRLGQVYSSTVGKLPSTGCSLDDKGEVESLKQSVRRAWLNTHPLPSNIPYFSIVALPASGHVSAILAPLKAMVDQTDLRNDSQIIYADAIIPGSILLGFVNADHWAIALPFDTQAPLLAATLVNRSRFPRAQLLEAAVLTVTEAVPP